MNKKVDLSEIIPKFDIYTYLSEIGVPYRESGRNVGNGAIGICCPLCGDTNFHMGVNIEKKFYNCWRCGDYDQQGRGNLFNLICLLEGVNKKSAFKKILKYSEFEDDYQEKDIYASLGVIEKQWEKENLNLSVSIPKKNNDVNISGSYKQLSELNSEMFSEEIFLSYIKKRKFTVNELLEWEVRAYVSGKFARRLVFPLYQDNKIVNYTGRDVTGKMEMKYLNCSNKDAVIPMKDLFFGLEYIKPNPEKLVLVEGALDTIRIGKGKAIGSMGLILSERQKELIYQLYPSKLLIMFDSEAWIEAEKIKKELGVFIDNIEVVRLTDGKDPADLTENELVCIFNEYNIK